MPKYPKVLLPNSTYKLITKNINGKHLIRFFIPENGIPIMNEVGEISDKYICNPREQVFDLSTALLGTFKKTHYKYEITKEGKNIGLDNYCLPNASVERPNIPKHFKIVDNKLHWAIPIQKVMDFTVDFEQGKPTEKYLVECRPCHTPTLSNFWHFSIRWSIDDNYVGDMIQNKTLTAGWAKRFAGHYGRVFIKTHATLDIPASNKIPKEDYCKR